MQHREGHMFDGGYINAVYMGPQPKSGWNNVQSTPTRLVQVDFTQYVSTTSSIGI